MCIFLVFSLHIYLTRFLFGILLYKLFNNLLSHLTILCVSAFSVFTYSSFIAAWCGHGRIFRHLVKDQGRQWSAICLSQFSSLLKFLILRTFPYRTPFLTPLTLFLIVHFHVLVSYEICAFCCETAKHCWFFSRHQRLISYFMLYFLPGIYHMPYKLKIFKTDLIFLKKNPIVNPIKVNAWPPNQPSKSF